MQRISSAGNSKIKRLASLDMKKARLKEGLFLVEGIKSVEEALADGAEVEEILVSESFMRQNPDFTANAGAQDIPTYLVDDGLFNRTSKTKTPQGILCSVKTRTYGLDSITAGGRPVAVLDAIGDPGNLGAIIRTADAFDFGGVALLPGCVDRYNPKTVRSTMGSFHRVKCVEADYGELDILRENGYSVYGTDLSGRPVEPGEIFKKPSAVIIGSESHGISKKAAAYCDELIKIPMKGRAESLNAALAAAIIMNMMQ
jgi:TrmH family RNA methyltransferase